MKKTLLNAIFIGCFLLAVCAVALVAAYVQLQSSSETRDRAYWQHEISRKDAKHAYAEFKEYYAQNPIDAHAAAHVMGELLFQNEGLQGITVCDDTFSSGCYHQFMTSMLLKGGLEKLKDIETTCMGLSDSVRKTCFHGVGHGLSEFFGSARLEDALHACDVFSDQATMCSGGVFMDYFNPLILDGSERQASPLPFDPEHPLGPCKSVEEQYQKTCYASLPHWWFASTVDVKEIGVRCERVPREYQKECFTGIGIDLPGHVSYDEQRIITECDKLPDRDASDACLKESAHTLKTLYNNDACDIQKRLGETVAGCQNPS